VRDRVERRRSIETELEPLRSSQYRELRRALNRLVEGLSDALVAELNSRIEAVRESTVDEVTRLEAARRAGREQARERRSAIDGQRRSLEDLRTEAGKVATTAGRLGERRARTVPKPDATPGAGPIAPAAPAGRGLSWTDG
jgi:hypothetical protein